MSGHSDDGPGGGLLAVLYRRHSLASIGVIGTALLLALLAVSVGVYTRAFSNPADVTVVVPRAGSQLSSGADVKLHGIVVGRVDEITARPDGRGATLVLAIDRERLGLIPSNVTAQILPKTFLGERYVALELPAAPASTTLAAGAVIPQSSTRVAIETRTVLNNLEPLITAVDPADLNATLTAVATALRGRGADLGETIDAAASYAHETKPIVDDFIRTSGLLADVSNDYADQAPPTLRTLANLTISGQTLTMKRSELDALLRGTAGLGNIATRFTAHIGPNLVEIARVSRPILELFARYSPEISCTVRAADQAIARLSASYEDGPYMKARMFVVVSRGDFVHGADDPQPIDLSGYGPYCPVTPSGGSLTVPVKELPEELKFLEGKADLRNNLGGATNGQEIGTTDPPDGDGAADSDQPVADLLNLLLGPVAG